jgi:hypothetical protein
MSNLTSNKPRQRTRPRGQDRPSSAGNLKMAYRYHIHKASGPYYIWADKRWKGDFLRELNQLKAARDRCDRKPGGSGVAWAEIYDCTHGKQGPVVATWKNGEWHSPTN